MDRHCYQPVRDDARSSRPPRSRVAQKPCKLCEYESQTYVATSVSVRAASCNEKDENLFLRAEKRYCCGLVQGAGPISGPREPSCPPTANVATSTTESGGAACHGSGQRGPYCRASVSCSSRLRCRKTITCSTNSLETPARVMLSFVICLARISVSNTNVLRTISSIARSMSSTTPRTSIEKSPVAGVISS